MRTSAEPVEVLDRSPLFSIIVTANPSSVNQSCDLPPPKYMKIMVVPDSSECVVGTYGCDDVADRKLELYSRTDLCHICIKQRIQPDKPLTSCCVCSPAGPSIVRESAFVLALGSIRMWVRAND